MKTELIGWIVSYIIIAELIFILWYKYSLKNPGRFFDLDGWLPTKILSFVIASIFMVIQATIVFDAPLKIFDFGNGSYINILYEISIILGLILLFYVNKLVANKMEKQE